MFPQDRSVQLMIRTMIYLGAPMTRRGRNRHFEGLDPRKDMPRLLKVWVSLCQASGILGIFFIVLSAVVGIVTDQTSFLEIFSSR
jgi:hypothetical protein